MEGEILKIEEEILKGASDSGDTNVMKDAIDTVSDIEKTRNKINQEESQAL